MEKNRLFFYLDDKEYAFRATISVPREGDLVRLGRDSGLFKVDHVVWHFENNQESVSIGLNNHT